MKSTLLVGLGHLGPGVGAIVALPQLVEPDRARHRRRSPLLDQVAGDHRAGAADAGAAMHVDAPAAAERRVELRQDLRHVRGCARHAVIGNRLARVAHAAG